jgi:hypothetical protein
MSVSAPTDCAASSAPTDARDDEGAPEDLATGVWLFVVPCRGGNGFRASVRGHLLDLADPGPGRRLAPTPRDLVAAALASDVAWFVRRLLRDRALDDYVSVSAWTSASEGLPTWCSFDVRVDVSQQAARIGPTLATALEERFVAQASKPPRIDVRSA